MYTMNMERGEDERLPFWGKISFTWIVLFLFWIIISGTFGWRSLLVGGLITLGVSVVMHNMLTEDIRYHIDKNLALRVGGILFFYVPRYVVLMIFKLMKSNYTVIKHVILKDIDPGIIKVKTDLDSDTGMTVLANSVSLNPGTLALDLDRGSDGNFLYIHWIDFFTVEGTRAGQESKNLKDWILLEREKAREKIKGGLEASLEKIFW